ncbi:PREDICTED: protein NETWORKED 3A-like [Ipomoea nil]|uniref:protein NETWORKED 3A-like n=1 Tax=Ipomoea nil TaxID=35883 RepID=UPI0009015A1E|nr:PREDICTED: protein NETWORKED 3A-like [Ipomoea nil]
MDNISSSSLSAAAASQFRPHHSPWLHNTLAEVDAKFKTILNLVEDDGETFAKRAEMYYHNKPQLLDLVRDLHKSYRVLAENHDHLSTHRLVHNSDKESSDSPRIVNDDEEGEEDYSIVKAASAAADCGTSPDAGDDDGGAEEAFWDGMKVVRDNESVLASVLRKYEEQRAEIGRLKKEIRFVRRLLDVERAEKQQKEKRSSLAAIPKFKKAFRRLYCFPLRRIN